MSKNWLAIMQCWLTPTALSASGTKQTIEEGQSGSALPRSSDVNLLGNDQSIVHFDAQVSYGAFDFGMPEQKLDGPEIAGAPIDQRSFRASQRVSPEQ